MCLISLSVKIAQTFYPDSDLAKRSMGRLTQQHWTFQRTHRGQLTDRPPVVLILLGEFAEDWFDINSWHWPLEAGRFVKNRPIKAVAFGYSMTNLV